MCQQRKPQRGEIDMNIVVIANNRDRRELIKRIFADTDISLTFVNNDESEIQADNSREIAKQTALKYAVAHNTIAIREHHALYLNHVYPFPGPYLAYFDKYMSADTLLEMFQNAQDRSGVFIVETVVACPDGSVQYYTHEIPITLATEKSSGSGNFPRLLKLKNEELTFAEKKEKAVPLADAWVQNYVSIRNDIINNKHGFIR